MSLNFRNELICICLTSRCSNNDKTVRVFSLAQNRVQATLHLPISTNHASISPDGKNLVVVGDSTKVYFYHSNFGTSMNCEAGREPWTLTCQLTAGTCDALISTAFSPTSVHCAVASQDGSITIFDTRYLSKSSSSDSPSPIVKQIPSSRPRTHAGAVRSVQFSPAPWDLLVWAEHSGRVTIADARSNFTKRQVIDVLNNPDEIVDVDVMGVSDEDCPTDCREEQRRRSLTREEEEIEEDTAAADEIEGYFRAHFMGRDVWMANGVASAAPLYPVSSGPAAPPGYMHPRHYMRNIPSAVVPPYTLNASTGTPHMTISTTDSSSTTAAGTRPLSPTTSNLLRDYRERQLERDRARQRIHDTPRRRNAAENVSQAPVATHPSHTGHATVTAPDVNIASANRPVHWRIDYEAQRRPAEEIHQLQRNREQLSQMIAEERRRTILRGGIHITRRHGTTTTGYTGGGGERESSDHHTCEDEVDITGCTMSVDGSKL